MTEPDASTAASGSPIAKPSHSQRGTMTDPQKPTHAPRLTWREREARQVRVALLNPGLVAPGTASPTAYEAEVLLVAPLEVSRASSAMPGRGAGLDPQRTPSAPRSTAQESTREPSDGRLESLADVAIKLGWTVDDEDLEDPERPGDEQNAAKSRSMANQAPLRREGVAKTRRVRIGLAPEARPDAPQVPPDAWRLLVEARKAGVTGLGLNHMLTTDALGSNPFTGNPFTGNPFTGNPFTGNPFTGNPFTGNPSGMAGYAYPGFGGRQPVAYVGPDLPTPTRPLADRPVVAILDTGCGDHPWLRKALISAKDEYGGEIGIVDPASDPDAHPSLGSPLDGVVDSAAGHGTFIAGIVLQACPEARILAVRVADGQGMIRENDLLGALGRLVAIVEAGHRLDVVNLSFSYYHESPKTESIDSELYALLTKLRAAGCVIVCSAGNDATDRPASPASLHHWIGEDCGIAPEGDIAPLVTVGALNPSRTSVALFSNIGAWVKTYVRGVSVLSTIPVNFEGGIQADLSSAEYDRRRETFDVDDFGSGFAVWSGTSFAAPVVAGRIAHRLRGPRAASAAAVAGGPTPRVAAAVAAAGTIVENAKTEDDSSVDAPQAAAPPE